MYIVMENEFIEFVPVIETHNAGDRVFIKSLLDAEGIVYLIQGEYVAPYLFNALPMRVMVKNDIGPGHAGTKIGGLYINHCNHGIII